MSSDDGDDDRSWLLNQDQQETDSLINAIGTPTTSTSTTTASSRPALPVGVVVVQSNNEQQQQHHNQQQQQPQHQDGPGADTAVMQSRPALTGAATFAQNETSQAGLTAYKGILAQRRRSAANWIQAFETIFRILWVFSALLFVAGLAMGAVAEGAVWIWSADPVGLALILVMGDAGRRGLCGRGCALAWSIFFLALSLVYVGCGTFLLWLPEFVAFNGAIEFDDESNPALHQLTERVWATVYIFLSLRLLVSLFLVAIFPLFIVLLVKTRPSVVKPLAR